MKPRVTEEPGLRKEPSLVSKVWRHYMNGNSFVPLLLCAEL